MDVEPGRCRRTDGKKWRCRLDVIPDQKYCERHVHRGCLRSRKPVEVNKTILMSNSTTMSSTSSLKATPVLQSATKSNARINNKLCVNNQSFKIKKRTTENALHFSFSPKSVLQHGNVERCTSSSNNHKKVVAISESERCKRTDGKKWRCSKEAIPKQKYCALHMHRGAKKVENPQNLNNSLSFSVGKSYQHMGDDGNQSNNSSCSSDSSGATTISM